MIVQSQYSGGYMAAGGGAPPPGNFKVYSCNTQGAGNVGFVTGEIKSNDVIMLQESGAPGFLSQLAPPDGMGIRQGVVNFGTSSRPCLMNVVHWPNGRCSLTVLVNQTLGPVVVPGLIHGPGGPGGGLRPILTATVGATTFGSIHAPSGAPAAATAVANHQLNQLDAPGTQYIVAGDFNAPALAQTRAAGRTGHQPANATHQGGNVLDGAVTSAGLNGNLINAGNLGSDHFGVRGTFF